jgi:multidrug resistance efflux pump
MSLSQFPNNDYANKKNSYIEALQNGEFSSVPVLAPKNQTAMNYTAPIPLPPRKGKKISIFFLLIFILFGVYKGWDTFFRYEAYGIVESDIVNVYSQQEGFVDNLYVTEGSAVNKGQTVAIISNVSMSNLLESLEDQERIITAELKSEEIKYETLQAETRANLIELQSRLFEAQGIAEKISLDKKKTLIELKTAKKLYSSDNLSEKEYNDIKLKMSQLQIDMSTSMSVLESIQEKVHYLTKIKDAINTDTLDVYKKKLLSIRNEKERVRKQIETNIVLSPSQGIVTSIQKRQGEKISDSPLFSILVKGTSKIVLFYNTESKVPVPGTIIKMMSPSLGSIFEGQVVAVSKNAVPPPQQIQTKYNANERLIKVYVEPKNISVNDLIVGSIVKKPNLFEYLGK